MPKLSQLMHWKVIERDEDADTKTYQAHVYCDRVRCNKDALLDDSTRYVQRGRNLRLEPDYHLSDEERARILAEQDAVHDAASAAYRAALLPADWCNVAFPQGGSWAFCSAICARKFLQSMEPRKVRR